MKKIVFEFFFSQCGRVKIYHEDNLNDLRYSAKNAYIHCKDLCVERDFKVRLSTMFYMLCIFVLNNRYLVCFSFIPKNFHFGLHFSQEKFQKNFPSNGRGHICMCKGDLFFSKRGNCSAGLKGCFFLIFWKHIVVLTA